MQINAIQATGEILSGTISKPEIRTNKKAELLLALWAQTQPSVTTGHTIDTCNAEIGHKWDYLVKQAIKATTRPLAINKIEKQKIHRGRTFNRWESAKVELEM